VEHIGDALIVDDVHGHIVFANDRFLNLFGFRREEIEKVSLEDYVAPEYRAELRDRHERRMRGEAVPTHFEYEGFRRDGTRMWLEVDVVPIENETGKLVGTQSALRDITERKRAEAALSAMSGRLIQAQEQERARIARELHDDINQRLALLAIELDQVQLDTSTLPPEVMNHVRKLRQNAIEISSDVQSLSHRLHSSKLEYLGVVGAMSSFCKEFAARQAVEVDFNHNEIPRHVSSEVSLCLFRVMQEALHNAAKHSKVRHFDVRLECSSNRLHLTVTDRGSGFDADTAMNQGGLGLISMRERVRLVNGMIAFESKPMAGTTVRVRVPIESEQSSQQAVGQ
jgi:PAS domain S-box-containing protein